MQSVNCSCELASCAYSLSILSLASNEHIVHIMFLLINSLIQIDLVNVVVYIACALVLLLYLVCLRVGSWNRIAIAHFCRGDRAGTHVWLALERTVFGPSSSQSVRNMSLLLHDKWLCGCSDVCLRLAR